MTFLIHFIVVGFLAWVDIAESSSYPEYLELDLIPKETIVGPGALYGYGRNLGAYDDGLGIRNIRGFGGFGRGYPNVLGRSIVGYGGPVGGKPYFSDRGVYGNDVGYIGSIGRQGGVSYVGSAGQGGGYSAGSKAEKGHHGESALKSAQDFAEEQGAKKQEHHDAGHYDKEGAVLQSHQVGEGHHGQANFQQAGKKEGQEKEAAAHKKGYSTKGFQNFHHKDETSKSTTFFDESNDEGDHYNYQGHDEAFGDNGGASYKHSKEDGQSKSAEHGQKSEYELGHGSDAARGAVDSAAKSVVHGDGEHFAADRGFSGFDKKHGLQSHQLHGNHFRKGFYGY